MKTVDEIREVILEQVRDVIDGMDEIEIDTSKRMSEYGAESLDILEVVGSSAREVGVRATREDLAGVESIDDLAQRFHELQSRPAAAPSPTPPAASAPADAPPAPPTPGGGATEVPPAKPEG